MTPFPWESITPAPMRGKPSSAELTRPLTFTLVCAIAAEQSRSKANTTKLFFILIDINIYYYMLFERRSSSMYLLMRIISRGIAIC